MVTVTYCVKRRWRRNEDQNPWAGAVWGSSTVNRER